MLRSGSQYVLELRLVREDGGTAVRSLRGTRCESVADAAALLVALALEPQADAVGAAGVDLAADPTFGTEGPPRRSSEPDASASTSAPTAVGNAQASTPAPDLTSPREAEPAQVQAPRATASEAPVEVEAAAADGGEDAGPQLGFAVDLAARLEIGTLPQSPSPAAASRVELRWNRFRLGAGLSFHPAMDSRAAAYPSARMRAQAVIGEAVFGFAFASGNFSVVPQASVEFGRVSVETRNIAAPSSRRSGWFAIGIGGALRYRVIAGFEIGFEAGVLAPSSRPRWWVRAEQGDVTLFAAAAVEARTSIGVAYVFE